MKTSENYVRKLIEENIRIDERGFNEYRSINVKRGVIKTAEGSALVEMGNTKVIVGVKMAVATPYPDSPDEGTLMVSAEFAPVASPEFEPGPPSPDSVELARVIDRGIRESHMIDMEKLVITPKEKVWSVMIDIHIIDHDGNLMDAAALASIAALLDTKIPKYEEERVLHEQLTEQLPLTDIPISVTVFKISNKMLLDLNSEEESALDARITIAITKNGDLCAIQKGGKGYFTTKELEEAADIAIEKSAELRGLLE